MIAGAGLYILSSIAYLLAPPFWPFLIVRILQGIGLAFFSTASFTLIANIASEIHRGQIISYYYLSFNFAFALAPYFGMLLINQFSFTVLFLVCAGLSLCTLFITAKMGKVKRLPIENRSIEKQPFLSREALPSAIMGFLLNVIWTSLGAFFPLYALTTGVSNPGIFFAVYAITLILGRRVRWEDTGYLREKESDDPLPDNHSSFHGPAHIFDHSRHVYYRGSDSRIRMGPSLSLPGNLCH